jgi:hypothetical protein
MKVSRWTVPDDPLSETIHGGTGIAAEKRRERVVEQRADGHRLTGRTGSAS